MEITTSFTKVKLSHLTSTILDCRHVYLCVVVAFWHPQILWLLPFCITYEAFLREYLLNVRIYRSYLYKLIEDCKVTDIYNDNDGLINNIIAESQKYELNHQIEAYSKWKKREKRTIILRNTNWNEMYCTSYNSVADYNIVIVPSNFDSHKIQHAIMVAHEYSHGMGHDGYKYELYSLILSITGCLLIFLAYLFCSLPNIYIPILGIISIAYIITKLIRNVEFDKELDADIGAIRYFENMDKAKTYSIPTRNNRSVLQEVAYDIAYIRMNDAEHQKNIKKHIKPIWPFLKNEDKEKISSKFPSWNTVKWRFNYSSTEDIYLVMFGVYSILALLVLYVSCIFCCIKLCDYVIINWYSILFALLPLYLLLLAIKKSNSLWTTKKNLLKKIGVK